MKLELSHNELDIIIGWGGVRDIEWDLDKEEKELYEKLYQLRKKAKRIEG